MRERFEEEVGFRGREGGFRGREVFPRGREGGLRDGNLGRRWEA